MADEAAKTPAAPKVPTHHVTVSVGEGEAAKTLTLTQFAATSDGKKVIKEAGIDKGDIGSFTSNRAAKIIVRALRPHLPRAAAKVADGAEPAVAQAA